MSAPIRLGIVGLHNQGREHLFAARAHPRFELRAVADTDPEELQRAVTAVGRSLNTYPDASSLLASGEVDAAVIALPHHLHPEVVRWAAERGIHLLKEKPLGRNLREAIVMSELMRDAGRVLHTGVQRRHHLTYQQLRAHLAGRTVTSASIDMMVVPSRSTGAAASPGWRRHRELAGGGVLLDLGYHAVDLAQFLMGPLELLTCTLAVAGRAASVEDVEDQASVWARVGRAYVHLQVGRGTEKRERVVIDCDEGRLEADREKCIFLPHGGTPRLVADSPRAWDVTMVEQLDSFAAAIELRVAAPNDLDTQLPALRLLEDCYARAALDGVPARKLAE